MLELLDRRGALVRSARWVSILGHVLFGVLLASLACAALGLLDANLELAAVSLFLVVVVAALSGYVAGFSAAAAGFLLLLYAFTPPIGEVVVRNLADLLTGVSFFVGAMGVGFVVAKLDDLRRRSERIAAESQLRVLFIEHLLDGDRTDDIPGDLDSRIIALFDLESCVIDPDATGPPPTDGGTVSVHAGTVRITVRSRRRLGVDELASIEQLAGVIALAMDRVRLAERARASALEADKAQSRSSFLTAITHDLRTPLSTIRAATVALLVADSELDGDERRELLELARDESYDLERLLAKVLDLTKVRSGPTSIDYAQVAPADLVSSAMRRVQSLSKAAPIEMLIDDTCAPINVDSVMMEQVIANLLENASIHSGSTRPVTVTASQAAAVVELRVIDHGRGIAPESRDRIFDEFVRAPATAGRGMGLGLAIVRHIVDLHQGEVRVETTPGGGATFVVSLPVHAAS